MLAVSTVANNNDPELQAVLDKIGLRSYNFYKDVASDNNSMVHGAKIMPMYALDMNDEKFKNFAQLDSEHKPYYVMVDFGNGTKRKMVAYDYAIFMNPDLTMDELNKFAKKNGVKFVNKKIKSFDEVNFKYIFNATGMGAKELNGDDKMVSVQGHLLVLQGQNPDTFNYMISFAYDKGETKDGKKIKRSIYTFPKHELENSSDKIGVIGGTFIEDADASTPHNEEFELLLKRAREFYGIR